MSVGTCRGDEAVELYFYDELPAAERACVEAHLSLCAACRESLTDLRAIQAALASRVEDAPPEDDWSGFMRRLDAEIDRADARGFGGLGGIMPWMKIAAALVLVATGVIAGWAMSRLNPPAPQQAQVAPPRVDRAIADAGESELARARVVLAGIAHKEEGAAWSVERRMAATLLPEVRLLRQVAAERGTPELEDILIDVEMLLLQASYAESADADTLARLRGMIDRRDMLMRLSVAAGAAQGPRKGI
jgi:hypothetical protein